jgi:hypothetical protein
MSILPWFILFLMWRLLYVYNTWASYQKEILLQKMDISSIYTKIAEKEYPNFVINNSECWTGVIFEVNDLKRKDTKSWIYLFFPTEQQITDSSWTLLYDIQTYNDWITYYYNNLCVQRLKTDYPNKFNWFDINTKGVFNEKLYFWKNIMDTSLHFKNN